MSWSSIKFRAPRRTDYGASVLNQTFGPERRQPRLTYLSFQCYLAAFYAQQQAAAAQQKAQWEQQVSGQVNVAEDLINYQVKNGWTDDCKKDILAVGTSVSEVAARMGTA